MTEQAPSSASIDTSITGNSILLAILIAVCASFVIACIEVPRKSKTSLKASFVIQSLFYFLVLSFGNVVTTLLVSPSVSKLPNRLYSYYFLFCAFFGVFGFEAILKNTNITMFGRGVLTIQNWIETALNSAVDAALKKEQSIIHRKKEALTSKLGKLTDQEINTRILNKCGPAQVKKLEADAAKSSADPHKYKVMFLITKLSSHEAEAIVRV